MVLSVWFWILILLYILYGAWRGWTSAPDGRLYIIGGSLLELLLFLTLGLAQFGGPIK